MIKQLPIIPTILVAACVAVMIALGIWQMGRAEEKAALIAQYSQVDGLEAIDWPIAPDADSPPLYRASAFDCLEVTDWRQTSGRSGDDAPGLVHVATCRLDDAGNNAQFVAGWSKAPLTPDWVGGKVSGIIAPDGGAIIRLVTAKGVGALSDVAAPSPEDLPNNHLAYAVQWFLFAAIATIIYLLAVRGRIRRRLR